MSKREFKVGDRVCCYGQNYKGWFDVINAEGDRGTITGPPKQDSIAVKMDNDYGAGRVCLVHPKQLRHLKPKAERRRIWVNEYANGDKYVHLSIQSAEEAYRQAGKTSCTEFLEVRKKD